MRAFVRIVSIHLIHFWIVDISNVAPCPTFDPTWSPTSVVLGM